MIIAVIFGLLSGMIGELVARVYILGNNFNIPLFGEIDLSQGGSGESSLVIRGAKNVIVQQDTKITDAARAVRSGVVDIFSALATTAPAVLSGTKATGTAEKFMPEDYYHPGNALAQGFIITSDGWIISDFFPSEMEAKPGQPAVAAARAAELALGKYVIITADKKIFSVDAVKRDELSGYSFWHIAAIDLPVRRFMEADEIGAGQLIFAENGEGWVWPATVSGLKDEDGNAGAVRSSDGYEREIILDTEPASEFYGSYLFNLNGDMAGFIGPDGAVLPISGLLPVINNLLKTASVIRPALGVHYIDLSEFIYPKGSAPDIENGALIAKDKSGVSVVKGSAADTAGLEDGDIIVSVDNQNLDADHDLRAIINGRIAGDEIDIVYLRNGERKEVKVKLGEMK